MTTYSDIRYDLQTGDIVLFSGTSLMSRVVQVATKSKWSHVGLVVYSIVWDTVFLFEAVKSGVGLIQLSRKVREYDGEVWVRKLTLDTAADFNVQYNVCRSMPAFVREMSDKPYERHITDFAAAQYRWLQDDDNDLCSLFCSELVAEFCRRLDLLPESKPSDSYKPDWFAGEAGELFDEMVQVK